MDKTAELKRAFTAHLPQRVAGIEKAWRSLRDHAWDTEAVEAILQRLGELTESCGKYGLVRIIGHLSAVELYLGSYVSETAKPEPRELDLVDDKFRALHEALAASAPGGGPAVPHERVYYLRPDGGNLPALADAMEERDLAVSHVTDLDDLRSAIEQHPPGVILCDGRLLEWLPEVRETLGAPGDETPVACLSHEQDLQHRLRALRLGVRVYFTAPFNNAAIARRLKELTALGAPHARVMVVDDEPSEAQFYTTLLDKAGMHALAVNRPTEVLGTLEAFKPDLVLMDLHMPGINGEELTALIRERPGFVELPVVFLSGERDRDRQLAALGAGADDFLVKPVEAEHLVKSIRNRLARADSLNPPSRADDDGEDAETRFNLSYLTRRIEQLLADRGSGDSHLSHGLVHISFRREDRLKLLLADESRTALYELVPAVLARTTEDDILAGLGHDSLALYAQRVRRGQLFELAASIYQRLREHYDSHRVAGFSLHPCVGVRVLDKGVDSVDRLIEEAASAYRLAEGPSGPVGRYFGPQPTLHTRDIVRSARHELVANAIERDAFEVSFLPVVDRADRERECYEMRLELAAMAPQEGAGALRAEAAAQGLLPLLDRRVLMHAIQALEEARDMRSPPVFFVEQSVRAENLMDTADWLRDQFRLKHLSGSGLVLEVPTNELVKDLAGTRAFFRELGKMGIGLCLSEFGITSINLKLLDFFRPELVRLSLDNPRSPAEAVVGAFSQVWDKGVRILLPRIANPHQLPESWLNRGDLIPSLFGGSARR